MTADVDQMATIIDVELLKRDNELEDIINWIAIKRWENVQYGRSEKMPTENKNMENCRYCNRAQHEMIVKRTIPTLYHIDLAEINRLVYD